MGYKVAVLTNAVGAPWASRVCEALEAGGHTALACTCDEALAATLRSERPDAAIVALRAGTAGEALADEAARELADLLGIALVGPGAPVCRALRNRAVQATLLEQAYARGGLEAPAPACVRVSKAAFGALGARGALDAVEQRVPGGFPMQVAPVAGGSWTAVDDLGGLEGALAQAFEKCDAAVVRELAEGVTLQVGILGDADDLDVLPAAQLCADGSVRVPVPLGALADNEEDAQAIRSEVERAALDAFFGCGCRDMGLVEVVWDGARARVTGIDPSPDLGEGSMLCRQIDAAGFDLGEMLDALVCNAVER